MTVLTVSGLSKTLNKKRIFEDVNLTLKEKEIVGLVGRSGCGKSVLIKTLIGFYKPDNGKIVLDSTAKDPIGFSMQDNSLYEKLTLKQNLHYFAKIYGLRKDTRKVRIPELMGYLNLQEFEKTLVKNLSGGTKKRVDIACALLKNPQILILDEPFLGLDPTLINNLTHLIKSLNKSGKTILISSHRVQELSSICSRIVLLRDKKLSQIKKSQIGSIYK